MGLPPQMNDCLYNASVIDFDTHHADKLRLNELITSLRAELKSEKMVMQMKNDKITGLNQELAERNVELKQLTQRIGQMETNKQDDSKKV